MKHEVKQYYSAGFLPKGVYYKNYTMLVAIANYSTNDICANQAAKLIDENVSLEDKQTICRMLGGFMHSLCYETFSSAWNKADGSNRDALLKGLSKFEIEL